jgi:hypothetical protein
MISEKIKIVFEEVKLRKKKNGSLSQRGFLHKRNETYNIDRSEININTSLEMSPIKLAQSMVEKERAKLEKTLRFRQNLDMIQEQEEKKKSEAKRKSEAYLKKLKDRMKSLNDEKVIILLMSGVTKRIKA